MPVMDGLEACRRICQRHSNQQAAYGDLPTPPGPKIIFLTAQVTPAFKEECREAGATSFLAKPCTIESLGKCLHQYCHSG